MNWNNIRPLQGSLQESFEELICQLARKENIEKQKTFIRKGKPDAGVECYWVLEGDTEIAWQAKYFLTSPNANQWGQIDKSVETVLDKHPNLKKYYVAIPNDPSDARIENQNSMLDKWNERVEKWKGWAEEKEMDVEFLPWWSSDMIERLQRPENVGLNYFWFNKEEFTDEWFSTINEMAIKALGKRYTPEIHVELEISKVLDGISRDDHFEKQITDYFDRLLINYNKIGDRQEDNSELLETLEGHITNLRVLFDGTEFQGINSINYSDYINKIDLASEATSNLYDYYDNKAREEGTDTETTPYSRRFGYEKGKINDLDRSLYAFRNFLTGSTTKLANLPALLIEGDAGMGKSHLLADTIVKRTNENKGSLLLLGQHFVTDEDPWVQISNKLQLSCTVHEFLGSLNAKAQVTGNRFIIFIDAINEGRGRYFWGDNLKAFLHLISKYEWLGVVLSIRSSYINLITPHDEITEKDIVRCTHWGFADFEYEASKIFFSNYNIDLPTIPLLHPEFQNPLFLKLFCEGLNKAGYTRIPDGLQGISSIINFFIDSSNQKLHKPNELDYPSNINVVKKAIEALMAEKTEKNLRYIEYERAYEICDQILQQYSSKRNLVDTLISEGVLSKNCYFVEKGKYEEGVYLTYERFEDHTIVSYLLSEDLDLEEAFKEGGTLFRFVSDNHTCHENRGVIDALSIQIPEKYSRELYEFTNHLEDWGKVLIAQSFVNSLLWRKTETLHEGLHDYINNTVLQYEGTFNEFWDTMIAVSVIPNNKFNAYKLHNILFDEPMNERDKWWSASYLGHQLNGSTSVKRLIDWSWNLKDKSHISDESILLASITLSWFLCTPNRTLRDYATKALIALLQNRLHLVIELLKKFEGINDPYIYDRLLAVALGASVRATKKKGLLELSEYIHATIFKDKEEVYPHILLRDYARGVIEYAHYLGIELSFHISDAQPPYTSQFFDGALSNEELEARYRIPYDSEDYKEIHRGQNMILHSMTTEYGRGIGGYGDFGRYTFQSALRYWNISADMLSNKAVEWIFEKYGYDAELHGEIDSNIPYSGRGGKSMERIGKKYQWIALYEMLARVADNVTDFNERGYWRETDQSHSYSGPWNPYVRDIDPTILIKDTGNVDEDVPTDFWWTNTEPIDTELSNSDWISFEDDIPDANQIISVTDGDGNEWLMLEGYPEWAEKRKLGEEKYDNPHKRMWWQVRSFLVKEEDYESFFEWTNHQNFWGRWMPESSDRYQVFNREYCWSPAYKFFQQEYYSGELWSTAYNGHTGGGEFELMVTANSYMWEEEFDHSKEKTLNMLKPSQHIFENMGIEYSQRDGEFINDKGEVVCFDPSVYFDSKQFLLVRKDEFLNYLKENKLKLVWTIIGEKQVIGGSFSRANEDDYRLMELSGSFKVEDEGGIVGRIRTELK